ncbi:putative oxidoreductase C736.13-like protein 5 [Colletotrichum chlorophyti]|uniref:Putative oxidoreductase C736.13-like protein 5 n=1 Tax=Colletotrichum chlorophyti TaxID=708187 RepID=A0A1Q8RWK0_9PEZI|nr:putative oxidoreductase C736.13-like protein 5 [Colletotrichum chlorophyti]
MTNTWNPLRDMPNLHGKIAVVTGGNDNQRNSEANGYRVHSSDIGRETIRLLAWKGAKVYFTTRSEAKAEQTRKFIQEKNPDIDPQKLQWLQMDLTDLRSIDTAAQQLNDKEKKLDILGISTSSLIISLIISGLILSCSVNNAAAATLSDGLVGPGWEQHMTVNYLGPFIFTNRLLPLLKRAVQDKDADVRVVTMSSNAQTIMIPRNFDFRFTSSDFFANPVPSHPWQWRYAGRFLFGFDAPRYAVSKAANLIFAQELQRRFDEQRLPILSMVVHPGEVATEGVFSINNAMLRTIARWTFIAPEQGAETPLFAAVGEEIRQNPSKYKGKFLFPKKQIGESSPVASDKGQVNALWQATTAEVNKQLRADGLPVLESW